MNGTAGGTQMFARTAIYRGVVVAIKPIQKSRVELSRSLLIELKNVNLHFDRLEVRFVSTSLTR